MADFNITKPLPSVLPSQQGLTSLERLEDCLEKMDSLYASKDQRLLSIKRRKRPRKRLYA